MASELAGRDTARFATLLSRAARYYEEAWRPDIDPDQRARFVRNFVSLFGHTQRHLAPQNRDDLEIVPAWPEAWPAIESMVSRFEGPESFAALQYWRRLGASIVVCTDEDSRLLGFMSVISLERVTEAEAARNAGTSYGTYRRHLAAAIRRLVQYLWAKETA